MAARNLFWTCRSIAPVFDRRQRQPAALRETQRRDAGGIDEGLLHQVVQGAVGIESQIDRGAPPPQVFFRPRGPKLSTVSVT